MRVSFHHADFDELAELWQASFPQRYHVSADLLRQHTVECPTFDWGASFIERSPLGAEGFVSIKHSPARLYKGPDKDLSHLNAIVSPEPPILLELFSEAKNRLQERGVSKVVFGQDSRHFFPGVPSDVSSLKDFVTVEGFKKGSEVYDLEADLQTLPLDSKVLDSYQYRTMVDGDRAAVQAFFDETFPGRWSYDVAAKIERDGPKCVFLVLDGDKVMGFALLHSEEAELAIGGAVWKQCLGEKYGSMGPLGVRSEVRNKGLGASLMTMGLRHMKETGVQRCIIDWTTLVDFYKKFGFEVSRTYTQCSLELD